MGITSKLTVKPLLYLCGVLFLALVGVSGAFYVDHADSERDLATEVAKVKVLEGDNGRQAARITELEGVNKTNSGVNVDLARRLGEAVGKEQATAQILADARAQRDRNARARDRALADLMKSRERTYANDPDCAAWAARPVCGGISDSLRLQWKEAGAVPASEGSGDRGEGEATRGDRPDVDGDSAASAATDPRASAGDGVPERLLLESATGSGPDLGPEVGLGLGGQAPGDPSSG